MIHELSPLVKLEYWNACVCMFADSLGRLNIIDSPLCLIPSGLHRTWGQWLKPQLVLCKPALEFSRTDVLWLRSEWQANPSWNSANHNLYLHQTLVLCKSSQDTQHIKFAKAEFFICIKFTMKRIVLSRNRFRILHVHLLCQSRKLYGKNLISILLGSRYVLSS